MNRLLPLRSHLGEALSQSASATLSDLVAQLHIPEVGLGNDPHSETEERHWATAYALIASSVVRLRDGHMAGLNQEAASYSVDWLLANTGCSSTGLPVWSLPYRRKIWLDDEPCKAGTGFTVPTAHAIQTMCEYSELGGPREQQCRDAAFSAVDALVSHCSTPIGDQRVFWYSTLEPHSFPVLNAVSLMAGEAQRVARLCSHEPFADAADEAVRYVLSQRQEENGVAAWNYFGDRTPGDRKNKRNDLLHEAFVCQGLLAYTSNGGRLAPQACGQDLQNAMTKFHRDGEMFDFPASEMNAKRRTHPARAIGLAQAAYFLSECPELEENSRALDTLRRLVETIVEERVIDGRIFYRSLDRDISTYVRSRAHLVLGLSQLLKRLTDTEGVATLSRPEYSGDSRP